MVFSQAQSLKNRLLVPLYIYPSISFGYDSNILKFSPSDINELETNSPLLSNAKYYDSEISRIKMKLFYSPVLSNSHETNFKLNIAHSMYGRFKEKSYSHLSMKFEYHLGSYNWFKIGYGILPKYFLRNYRDLDSQDLSRYPCTFTYETVFASYSFPLSKTSWIKMNLTRGNEFYNERFTEFDQQKTSGQIRIHSKFSKNIKYYFTILHGVSNNISFHNGQISTHVDRSYIFDSVGFGASINPSIHPWLESFGFTSSVEQRLYDLVSQVESIDDWKYYLEFSLKLWSKFYIQDGFDFSISYQYNNRDADSNPSGEFIWVEDVKDFSKHVFWIDFNYDLTLDLFY